MAVPEFFQLENGLPGSLCNKGEGQGVHHDILGERCGALRTERTECEVTPHELNDMPKTNGCVFMLNDRFRMI